MEDAALLSVPARIAKRLLSLARLQGVGASGTTRLTISQEELAQFLSVSRQVVNQHLQLLKAKGWIRSGCGQVTICDAQSLETLAQER